MNKIKIIKYNNYYNIIKIQRNGVFDYYIEKIGYGDLKYAFGCYEDFEIFNKEFINNIIDVAEKEKFWE